jgi:HEAT repeats
VSDRRRDRINELVYDHPAVQAEWASDPRVARRRQLYADHAAAMLDELAAAGFSVDSAGELPRRYTDYRAAVPILLRSLPTARYLALAEDIVRVLSVPFARAQALPVFLVLFREPPQVEDPMLPPDSPTSAQEHLRWVIGNGLGIFAGPDVADELLELAGRRDLGEARTQVVLALPKAKDSRVPRLLLDLLDDPTVAAFAAEALGKMKTTEARERLRELVSHPDKNVRDQAKKALRRIDAAGTR